jgi:ADP-heptose:LPS heptosyltransferase/glycosyltransferase involved in cell wall biosynthesis
MNVRPPRVSLVVPTVNRVTELARLFDSLLGQEFADFEIVVVDQNNDARIVPVLERYHSRFNISRIPTPDRQGASSARNDGWHRARADVIVFPDDDCWYPPWFLRKGLELLDTTGADLVCGRIADETGRSINGRFASRAQLITRRRVFSMAQSEPATFCRRELLERVGGFYEAIGIGSTSPWQAAEGPDLVLTALERGSVCYYDPSLYGFHREYDLDDPASGMPSKGRSYARGMGYVLRRHRFGALNLLYWASRPLVTAFISAIGGRFHRAYYSLLVSVGRIEGWLGRVLSGGADAADRSFGSAALGNSPKRHAPDPDSGSGESYARKRREMTGPYRARNPLLVGSLYAADGVARLLPKRRQEVEEDRPLRVLVANWGHLGDVVTILPLLKFLEQHPRVQELGVLIGSGSRSVLEASDIAAKIHTVDHWALNRSDKPTPWKVAQYFVRRVNLVDEIRRCRYDMSIDLFSTFPSTHGITWSASIPRRVGFTSGGLGSYLTDQFDWIPNDRSMLNHQLKLLKPLLDGAYPQSLAAAYPGFGSCDTPEQLQGLGLKPYIVIHMGPQNIRGWVFEKWVLLATALKDQGYELVATGGPGREIDAARLLSTKIPILDLTGRISWQQFVATVSHATALVSIDSVAGHVAACFGVPAVILAAGRQRIELWQPNSANAMMVTHPVACAPCHRTDGCSAMACVKLIEVAEVLSSLQQVMKLPRTNQPEQPTPKACR